METCKILFVGSNPSQKSKSTTAFWNDTKSSQILGKWLQMVQSGPDGVDLNLNMDNYVSYINVSDKPTPDNRPLKMSEIKQSLDSLAFKIYGFNGVNPQKIVALGKTAQTALTLLRLDFYAMPHPSGLNRQLNDPAFVEEKIKGLREYLSPSVKL